MDCQGFVKWIWTFVIGICSTDDSALAWLDRFLCPLCVSAAAGGRHIVYDQGLVANVPDIERTFHRAVAQEHVPEIEHGPVKLDTTFLHFLGVGKGRADAKQCKA